MSFIKATESNQQEIEKLKAEMAFMTKSMQSFVNFINEQKGDLSPWFRCAEKLENSKEERMKLNKIIEESYEERRKKKKEKRVS